MRKLRSLLLGVARRVSSAVRVAAIRLVNDSVDIPWSTRIERGVLVQVTDGGSLRLSAGCSLGAGCRITVHSGNANLGERVLVGPGCVIVARQSVRIGNRVLIGEYVTIRDQDHCIDTPLQVFESGFDVSPVEIGDDAWLGAKATVLRGSILGRGSVVGAHCVVRGHVPAGAIAAGVPARIVRQRLQSND